MILIIFQIDIVDGPDDIQLVSNTLSSCNKW